MGFRETAHRIAELAPQMDLAPHVHKPYHQLSLGMQQKAALVAAFLPDVTLRIMDEPFSGGIDPLAMEVLAIAITAASRESVRQAQADGYSCAIAAGAVSSWVCQLFQ